MVKGYKGTSPCTLPPLCPPALAPSPLCLGYVHEQPWTCLQTALDISVAASMDTSAAVCRHFCGSMALQPLRMSHLMKLSLPDFCTLVPVKVHYYCPCMKYDQRYDWGYPWSLVVSWGGGVLPSQACRPGGVALSQACSERG